MLGGSSQGRWQEDSQALVREMCDALGKTASGVRSPVFSVSFLYLTRMWELQQVTWFV